MSRVCMLEISTIKCSSFQLEMDVGHIMNPTFQIEMDSSHIINPTVIDFGSNIKFEEKAETSIKLEDQKLTKTNDEFKNDFNPIFGNLTSPSNSHEAITTRLASIYEDPNYGPGYFRESARILKSLLFMYKALKTDPTCDIFYVNKNKTGIHIHFNTMTHKMEVVIPLGCPGMDPVRIDLGKFRSWYKKQRMAAIAARIKAQEEINELRMKVAKTALDRAYSYLEQCRAELAMQKALLEAYKKGEGIIGINKLHNLREMKERIESKPKRDFLSHNEAINKLEAEKGMYEEKFFMEKMLEAMESYIKKCNDVRDIYHSFTGEILLL